ncbi:MAG: putative toxin-antitoxin system toxin component, PIN family [Sterolibacterium sp.]|jgi:putative PIN family toxin of toxin-antitoxin system|nr:putative toxin-antitoxin system toxin component, PIN family [Sterolibacterium sp.]
MTEQKQWVLDTNVLISRLLAPNGTAAQAVDRALAGGVLLLSEATLSELVEVLYRPKFDPYLGNEDRRRFISLLSGVSRLITIAHPVRACRDPKDDKFLDVALNGNANAILTGDADLLVLHPFHDINIMTPAQFLAEPIKA